ncbi:GbsR/MarR family transcriptional regulator [Acidocella aromatica]|uniref:HTH-type transcriptional regulator n=1 Tax=Acidocella aromatica TaxID=1303579 RepID=A0A840VT34_9PROT|nr:GbsR/MarR family transcriptional regulator [Acidocella aromatica]MBB5373382.1 DNA-binding transcriptional regulator GbsR (MarR family) [Acidocella aromatica]
MELSPLTEAFVLHFGEMGSRWGINRTVGQIYALLYISDRPLPADEIAQKLDFSRSNVSMGLKELQSWRLVRLQHLPGDRREHFSTPDDIWEIVRTLAEQRRRREVDPTLSVLRDLIVAQPASESDKLAQNKLREMHDLIELLVGWADEVSKLDTRELVQLLKLGSRVVSLLELKNRLPVLGRNARRRAEAAPPGDDMEPEF